MELKNSKEFNINNIQIDNTRDFLLMEMWKKLNEMCELLIKQDYVIKDLDKRITILENKKG